MKPNQQEARRPTTEPGPDRHNTSRNCDMAGKRSWTRQPALKKSNTRNNGQDRQQKVKRRRVQSIRQEEDPDRRQ